MNTAELRPYAAPSMVTLDQADLIEALGPAQTQYLPMVLEASDCLPLRAGVDTVQDTWTFEVPVAGSVKIFVDSVDMASTPGPLDPKFALYPPGVTPLLGPFNGHVDAAACGGDCIIFDTLSCTTTPPLGDVCPYLDITLTPGVWTIAIAPDSIAGTTGSQGCYELQIEGLGVRSLTRTLNDDAVVFRPRP